MWKKIIVCFVILAYLLVIMVPQARADDRGANKLINYSIGLLVVMGGLLIISGVIDIAKKVSPEKPIPPEQPIITPKKDTSSLPAFSEKANSLEIIGTDYASFTNSQNLPIEFSSAGVVVLKW